MFYYFVSGQEVFIFTGSLTFIRKLTFFHLFARYAQVAIQHTLLSEVESDKAKLWMFLTFGRDKPLAEEMLKHLKWSC